MQQESIEGFLETDVVTVQRDASVEEIVSEMAEHDVGSVIVVDDEQPVGVITDREIALTIEDEPEIAQLVADDLIAEDDDLVTATTEMTLFEALEELSEGNVRRLPIVDEDDHLAGIVTLDDVLVLLSDALDDATEVIEAQSPRF